MGRTARYVALAVLAVLLAGCCVTNARFGSADGSFSAADAEQEAIGYAANNGFGFSKTAMATIVAIGIGESSLNSAARNWHTEYAPRADVCCDPDPARPMPKTAACYPKCQSDRGWLQISSRTWGPSASKCATQDIEADVPGIATQKARCIYDATPCGGRCGFDQWDAWLGGVSKQYAARYSGTLNGWPSTAVQVDLWCNAHGNPQPACS